MDDALWVALAMVVVPTRLALARAADWRSPLVRGARRRSGPCSSASPSRVRSCVRARTGLPVSLGRALRVAWRAEAAVLRCCRLLPLLTLCVRSAPLLVRSSPSRLRSCVHARAGLPVSLATPGVLLGVPLLPYRAAAVCSLRPWCIDAHQPRQRFGAACVLAFALVVCMHIDAGICMHALAVACDGGCLAAY